MARFWDEQNPLASALLEVEIQARYLLAEDARKKSEYAARKARGFYDTPAPSAAEPLAGAK